MAIAHLTTPITPMASQYLLPPPELEDVGTTRPTGLLAMLEHGDPQDTQEWIDVGYLASLIEPDVWKHALLMDVLYGPYPATEWMVWVGGAIQAIRKHARPLYEPPPAVGPVRIRATLPRPRHTPQLLKERR